MVCQRPSFKEAVFLNSLKLLNIFVMIISAFMLFVGCDLVMSYFMDSIIFSTLKSDAWPIYSLPWVFIGVGGVTLMTSIACFICSVFRSKRPVIGYAIVMIFLVLGKFSCLFVTFKAQGVIEHNLRETSMSEPNYDVVESYYNDEVFRTNWDDLQTQLRCCGGNTFQDFYINTTTDCFPLSCRVYRMEQNESQSCVQKVRHDINSKYIFHLI
jgi:hypothetical protein